MQVLFFLRHGRRNLIPRGNFERDRYFKINRRSWISPDCYYLRSYPVLFLDIPAHLMALTDVTVVSISIPPKEIWCSVTKDNNCRFTGSPVVERMPTIFYERMWRQKRIWWSWVACILGFSFLFIRTETRFLYIHPSDPAGIDPTTTSCLTVTSGLQVHRIPGRWPVIAAILASCIIHMSTLK